MPHDHMKVGRTVEYDTAFRNWTYITQVGEQ